MACCLMAPSHYLNQCWLVIGEVLWHSPEGNVTRNAQDNYPWYKFENYWFKIIIASPRAQWVQYLLTYWGRAMHICVGRLTIIGSDNGLSPGRRQAIIWTNAGILLIEPLGTNFNEILIGIQTFSFKKMHLKVSSAKWRPPCLGLNVLKVPLCHKEIRGMTQGETGWLTENAIYPAICNNYIVTKIILLLCICKSKTIKN